ncbi:hypothetical protein ACFYY8_10065 [Streptosporangium sp. NPDC001559]|uniref:hypothetical protein n=1 Tax=Streptosporangium sp. NPDC001559 TaxID=3366187 RepID=UPI0036E0CF1E
MLDRDGRKAAAFTVVRIAASAASLTEKRPAGFCAKQGCSGERLAAILLRRGGQNGTSYGPALRSGARQGAEQQVAA